MDTTLLVSDENRILKTISLDNQKDYEESALLGDDESVTYRIKAGETTFTLDLGDFYNINRFHFESLSAQGRIEIQVSNTLRDKDSNRWITVAEPMEFIPGNPVNIVFPMIEGRFVNIIFSIQEEGEISSFNIFGDTTVAEIETREYEEVIPLALDPASGKTVTHDYASLHTGSNISHVSSGDLVNANSMIDDDIRSYYDFAQNAGESVLVLDLENQSDIDRISLLLDSGQGKMDFYFLDKLPETNASKAGGEIPEGSPDDTGAAKRKIATIILTQITGDVTYRVNAKEPAQIGQNGVRMREGAVVETGIDSTAVLLFSNGSTLTLSEKTKIDVDQFTQEPFTTDVESFIDADEEPSISITMLKLNYGEIVGDVKKLKAKSIYEIETPVGIGGIRGTSFIIQVIEAIDGTFTALFGVNQGLLEVIPLGQGGINISTKNQIIINIADDPKTGEKSVITTGTQGLDPELVSQIEQTITEAIDVFKESAGAIILIEGTDLTAGERGPAENGDFAVVSLSEDFFNETEPISTQKIEGRNERVRFQFEEISGRYLVLRWQPDEGNIQGLRIYEISMLGEVPTNEVLLTRVPIFEFSPSEGVIDVDTGTSETEVIPETPTEIIVPPPPDPDPDPDPDPGGPPEPPPDPPPVSN